MTKKRTSRRPKRTSRKLAVRRNRSLNRERLTFEQWAAAAGIDARRAPAGAHAAWAQGKNPVSWGRMVANSSDWSMVWSNPDDAVGNIILEQMGGIGRLRAMIGAKDFVLIENGVQFGWPSSGAGSANKVVIKLEPSDTYRVQFWWIRGAKMKLIREVEDIYAEQLVPLFERETGLYLTFGGRQRMATTGLSAPQEKRLKGVWNNPGEWRESMRLVARGDMETFSNVYRTEGPSVAVAWDGPYARSGRTGVVLKQEPAWLRGRRIRVRGTKVDLGPKAMEREPHRSIGVWPADEMGRPDPESGSVLNTYVGEYLEEMARPARNAKRPVVRVFIRKEPESFSATGFAYRVYRADDGTPEYIGAETLAEAKAMVRKHFAPFRVEKIVPEPVKRNSSPAEDRLSAARTKAMHRSGGYLPQGDCDFCGARSGASHHADCPVIVPWWTVTEHIEGSAIPGGFPAHEARTAVQAVTARGAVAAARRHRGLEPANEVEPTGQMRQDRLTGRSTQVWLVNGRRVRVEAHDGWKDMQHWPAKGTGA